MDVLASMKECIAERALADAQTPVLLMVSGGSDSTALAHLAADLHVQGALGPLAILHVNHRLRGADADADEGFVRELAELLGVPLLVRSIDVGAIATDEGGNVEAVARRERYRAADEALVELCRSAAAPVAEGRIFTAHTADDRVESFYMRSIVGTGPGGFRAMRYRNGRVCRPLLDASRERLRSYLRERAESGQAVARDAAGALWREDATNAHTDRFRAFVRHEIVPRAKERNPRLLMTLTRTMNLIADEDDMLRAQVQALVERSVVWLADEMRDDAASESPAQGLASEGGVRSRISGESVGAACSDDALPSGSGSVVAAGCVLSPSFGEASRPLARRAVDEVLQRMLGAEARIEAASVEAVLDSFRRPAGRPAPGDPAGRADAADPGYPTGPLAGIGAPRGGYVANIQGDLAVSANKRGVRIEPMAAFRARRKRG